MTGQSGGLRILPFLDSEEMAAVRRRELDIPRDVAIASVDLPWKLQRKNIISRRAVRTSIGKISLTPLAWQSRALHQMCH